MDKDNKDIQNIIKDKVDEYISILCDPKDIFNIDCFNGLLSYIGDNIFKDNSIIDLSNISQLDLLFSIYRSYCGKYKQKIYLTGFCFFSHVDYMFIQRILIGKHKVGVEDFRIVANWVKACEHSQISADSRKSEYLLSTIYGYALETKQDTPTTADSVSQLPPADGLLLPEQN